MPVLPPSVAWTLGTVAAALMVKLVAKEWKRINEELDRVRRAPVVVEPELARLPRLRRDPVTGIYRP